LRSLRHRVLRAGWRRGEEGGQNGGQSVQPGEEGDETDVIEKKREELRVRSRNSQQQETRGPKKLNQGKILRWGGSSAGRKEGGWLGPKLSTGGKTVDSKPVSRPIAR